MRALLAICVALVALPSCGGSECDHLPYCDGDTLVYCTTREDDSTYETREPCSDRSETCVEPAAAEHAFCTWSPTPLPECGAAASTSACSEGRPTYCAGGYPTEPAVPDACGAGTSCVACTTDGPVAQFAGCALGSAAEPLCTATTRSTCDAATQTRFDCTCGWRSYEAACDADCVSVASGAHTYGLCTYATAPDPQCGAANDAGDSGWCAGDVLTECFLGYPVRHVTCQPGMCVAGTGPVLAACNGLPVSEEGLPRGGAPGLF